jgi:hypothetical protein
MTWKKNSPKTIRRFDDVAGVPGAVRKIMFGCPVYELHGQREPGGAASLGCALCAADGEGRPDVGADEGEAKQGQNGSARVHRGQRALSACVGPASD